MNFLLEVASESKRLMWRYGDPRVSECLGLGIGMRCFFSQLEVEELRDLLPVLCQY